MAMENLTSSRDKALPLDVWWQISRVITSRHDLYRLSRANKTLWSFFTYRRAVLETQHYLDSVLDHPHELRDRHPDRSCVENAIRSNQPLEVIEAMIRGCYRISLYYLEGPERELRSVPAIFVAAEHNRLDVIKELMSHGYDINLRHSKYARDCEEELGHLRCSRPSSQCRNALCVAREARSTEAETFLLEQGIEDRCDDRCAWRHNELDISMLNLT
ncbi:hypothetical protein F5Y13DRAFT_188867 [Hypoxylon sp. FL1857]|nr:hypothetical protein F5Y13DRAFT_188867 [Hypoxylon sp. FL1857]